MSKKTETPSSFSEGSFFEYLPEEKLAEIAKLFKMVTVPRGTVLFRQGEPGNSFYIIRSGKVKAFRKDEEGVETDLAELGPGDSFGEIALLTGKPRSASAETLEETVLNVLPKEYFDQVLKDYPVVALSFVKVISNMLLQDWSKLEQDTQLLYKPQRLSWLDFFLIFIVVLICGFTYNFVNPQGIRLVPQSWSEEPVASVPPAAAIEKYQKGEVIVVDARPTGFYAQEHIKGALSIPLEVFDIVYLLELEPEERAKEVLVYGRTISSLYDEQVARKLQLRGHKHVAILAGGLPAWKKKGFPVEP
jgi:rhodanese-related sulfurtransferase